jgi:threonyl-tRNA synthetase
VRLLLIHAENFEYEAKEKAIEYYEEENSNMKYHVSNALVVFTTVEREDEKNPEEVVGKARDEIIGVLNKINASKIIIYPYAHLSSNLASPNIAMKVLKMLEDQLKNGIEVVRAPFGWYKRFSLTCYGHPLSELSRQITPTITKRRQINKEYYIITKEGDIYKPEDYKFKEGENNFKALIEKEVFNKTMETSHNRTQEFCKKFGFEWEPFSDNGHMRYEPHAMTIFDAISEYSWKVVQELGISVFKIKGTNTFNLEVPAVKEHAELFGDRLYELDLDNERLVLRYAACHQQFAMLRDWNIGHKYLPLGMLEIADSYRYEQKGELLLCFRLRKFHMPDLHILTRDLKQAMELSLKIQDKIFEEVKKIGQDYELIINVTKDFLDTNKEFIVDMLKRIDKNALLVVYPSGIYYWVINVEYNIIDIVGHPREIATFQIDIGNARRFNIKYVDENNEIKFPMIIHTAIIGSIERYVYAVMDRAAKMEKEGKTPLIPLWLAPIQVRIIPVSKSNTEYALRISKELEERGFRVDVDDREESLAKRMREAGLEWVPYIVVVGEKEEKEGSINIRDRERGEQRSMKLSDFINMLEERMKGYPKVSRSMPLLISKRPAMSYLFSLT